MNTNSDDERLDELLGQWSAQTAASQTQLDALQQSIIEAATETAGTEAKLNGHASELVRPAGRGQQRSAWAAGFAVGSVAMLFLAIGIWFVAMTGKSGGSTDLTPDYAWLRDEQVQNKERLLSEMDAMFDGQLAWLAETGDRIEFGLAQSADDGAGAVSGDADHVAVRVVVERRASDGDDWQVAWALDVVSRSEEFVSLSPQDADGNELKLWTYRLPNGLIAVDSELDMAGRDGLHATTSVLQEDRHPVKVFTGQNNGAEYRVFQTVAVLDGGVG